MTSAAASRPASLDRIVRRFQRHSDPKQRYRQLLAYAQRLDDLPAEDRVPENKVSGCVSQVYVTAVLEDGKVMYSGTSDAQLVKGLLALLVSGLNGLTPQEIVQVTPDFIEETGLQVSLTPSRANGFYNIFRMMQNKALALQAIARA
ncbi:SufE protein probably involved in Fe-S center assembly [Rubidibacter lacunae KORDI 51-2]|uniref:SufE protein probably involved in Fe-S center assembly n=1 Tax=Rubidibacter lacunae KORDI 51-2 TaxID=582515 RepID=U5DNT9_9CHRO|nr:SufE family protein [Rubidibacter lacunae]ERN42527.1 SufE protein probably involved in Fe-S center assembly [Rubidibacter lacunae KORDI 51-2]